MAHEKLYTAKQAAEAVLEKAGELLKKYESLKKSEHSDTWNSKKLGVQAPHRHQDEIDEEQITGDHRIREQVDPNDNMKEKAEGNNQTPGAHPQNTKKYLMEKSVDKFGAPIRKSVIDKVQKCMSDRMVKTEDSTPNIFYNYASNLGIFDLTKAEALHGSETYILKSESLVKGFGENFAQAATSGSITPAKIQEGARSVGSGASTQASPPPMKKDNSIAAGIAAAGAAGGVPHTTPAGSTQGAISAMGQAFGKSEKNPDEKQDAELGEKVEHDVERHMEENKEAEKKEGHKMAKADPIAAKNTGVAKLAKFVEFKKSEQLKKS